MTPPHSNVTYVLSDEQKQVIESDDKNLIVVAGAGSGKTTTLTAKIAYDIDNGYNADKIVAITFTNKAADELTNRLFNMGYKIGFCGTLHKFANYILNNLKHDRYRIRHSERQEKVFYEYIIESIRENCNYSIATREYLDVHKEVTDSIVKGTWTGIPDAVRIDIQKRANEVGNKWKSTNFDGIIRLATNYLKRSITELPWNNIYIDEVQDLKKVHCDFIVELSNHVEKICCVGDEKQRIYAESNAISDILSRLPNAKLQTLRDNYRCGDTIVKVADSVYDYIDADHIKQISKANKVGSCVLNYYSREKYMEGQINGTVEHIVKWHNDGTPYSDIAILLPNLNRNRDESESFKSIKEILKLNNIPYKVQAAKSKKCQEVVDFFQNIMDACNPTYEANRLSIIAILSMRNGIGTVKANKIYEYIRNGNIKLSPTEHRIYEFYEQVFESIDMASAESIYSAAIAYAREIKDSFNVNAFSKDDALKIINSAIKDKYCIIDSQLVETIINRLDNTDGNDDGVCLSTIHSAKGQEYKNVIILDCNYDAELGFIPMYNSIERCTNLVYVAITRAKNNVVIYAVDDDDDWVNLVDKVDCINKNENTYLDCANLIIKYS